MREVLNFFFDHNKYVVEAHVMLKEVYIWEAIDERTCLEWLHRLNICKLTVYI